MKKRILIALLFITVLSNISFALTLADLNTEEKIMIEDAVLAADTEITPATFESLEGIRYELIYKNAEYHIIKVGDRYVVVITES